MPPSSQPWCQRRWFLLVAFVAQVILIDVECLARVVAFCVSSGFGFMWQLDPFYQAVPSDGAPPLMSLSSKFYYSHDAIDEIHGVQDYIAALARHDLSVGSAVHVVAAFDLEARSPTLRAQGHRDWASFCMGGSGLFRATPTLPIA